METGNATMQIAHPDWRNTATARENERRAQKLDNPWINLKVRNKKPEAH